MGGGLGGRALCADLPAAEVKALRQFLQHAVDSGEDHPAEIEAQFAAAAVDLNGDGVAEYVVYLTGELWCRNAGCRAWVIAKQGAGFRVVSEIAPVQLPIAVLKDRLSGWRTLLVQVDSGGGMMPGIRRSCGLMGRSIRGIQRWHRRGRRQRVWRDRC